MKKKKDKRTIVLPLVFLVIVIAVWQLIVSVSGIDITILPGPYDIFCVFRDKFVVIILPDLLVTVKNMLIGFSIAVPLGIGIAALCSQSRAAIKIVTPIIIMFLVTPMMTLIPVFMIFLGFSNKVKIIVVVLQTMPIIMLNSLNGFRNVKDSQLKLMASYGGSKWTTFWKVTFMNALPEVFGGIRLGSVLCTIGAVSADIGVSSGGVGTRIQNAASTLSTDTVFATIISICLVGICFYSVIARIEKKCLRR